jgi:phosphoribosylaminoimidazole (AIR) synthetase
MGIGMVLIVPADAVDTVRERVGESFLIGEVVAGNRTVELL